MSKKNITKLNNESTHHSARQLLSLSDLINIVWQRWILASSVGFVLAALFAVLLLNQTSQYKAEASIVVELNADNVVNVQEVVESGVKNSSLLSSAMNTHIERLKSRMMAQKVLDTLSDQQKERLIAPFLGQSDEIKEDEPTPDACNFLAGNMLHVSWKPDSQVLRIAYTHTDKRLAKLIADRYASRYISMQLELRGASTNQAVEFLDEQAIELRARLEKEEEALQKYRDENDLVTVEQNQLVVTERLRNLNSVITAARVRMLSAESRMKQIDAADGQLDQLMNIPFIGGRANIERVYSNLQALKTEANVLAETYLERHPKAVENLTKQRAVEKVLWLAIRQAGNEVDIERQTTVDELNSLQSKLDEAEYEARRLESLSIEYRVLARKVDAQREIFDRITSRFNETSIAQQMNLTTMRILDYAALPNKPVWPDTKKIALASIFIFVAFFFGVPFGIELFDNRLRTFADIERFACKLILGDIPEMRGCTELEIAQVANNSNKDISERFRSIFGFIRLNVGELLSPHTFLFTSSVPTEGKSVVVSNMGYVFAAHGFKTILVDFDLRRPSVHKYKDVDNLKGLVEWVRSGDPLADNIIGDPLLGIRKVSDAGDYYILTSGGSTRQASEIIGHDRMDLMISRLRQEFDIILLDTPPVGVFQDAIIAADYADHTIFVARQNVTTRQKTRHSIGLMDRTEAPVLGVAFNGVKNVKAAAGLGGYYGNSESYGAQYSYSYGRSYDRYKNYYSDD
ncbi:MAG: polysaccharide biosynthesis tyrosine autokinase [Verrucomicrobiota bacterium]|nr:polysaccharide biosynthesis tyrosine autokinase [Verrucomicrobiota bacterium]